MKSHLVSLLIGLVLGAAVSAVLWRQQQLGQQAQEQQFSTERDQLRTEQTRLRQQVASLEDQNARLTADNLALKRPASPAAPRAASTTSPAGGAALAALFGGGDKEATNKQANVFAGLVKASMQQQIEGKLSALKLRLKLSEAQETAVHDLLQAQFDRIGDSATKMLTGKLSKDEMQKLGNTEADVAADIRQVLTPEQLAEYEKFQQEERATQAARVANMELLQLQSALQLTAQQQEQVYNILYDQTLHAMDAKQATIDPMQAWQKQLAAKTEALRGVLTPEQYKAYEKQQEAQRQMIAGFMQSFGGGSNNLGGASIQIELAP